MPGVLDAIIGGWQISGIHTATSGEPLNVVYSPGTAFQVSDITSDWRGSTNTSARPNLIGTAVMPEGRRQGTRFWLDPAAFAIPTDVSQPFGNLGRNSIYGPSFFQLDTNVQKNFRITESVGLQFRSEFFNLLNRTNFRAPVVNRSASNFGQFTQTYQPRQIQFALKLTF
jgi:hypothetical protein